jgi:hypothetical protein
VLEPGILWDHLFSALLVMNREYWKGTTEHFRRLNENHQATLDFLNNLQKTPEFFEYRFVLLGCMLWPRKVPRKRFSFHLSWNWNIFMGTNTFEHAEFKSEKFPLCRPAVFSQTAILSSLISRQLFSLFNDTDRWWQTIMSLKNINFN